MNGSGALRDSGPGRSPVRRPAPHLQVVRPTPYALGPTGVIVLCVLLLTGGLAVVLALNLSLEQGSYTLSDQESSITALEQTNQQLTEKLASSAAPSALARRARSLGMVDNTTAEFIGTATPTTATTGTSGP